MGSTIEMASQLTMRDWFATFAPDINELEVAQQVAQDINKTKSNDRYQARSEDQIRAELRYKWADEMMKARTKQT